MACDDLGLEIRYFSALGAARSWRLSGGMLRLFGADGAELAGFTVDGEP